MQYLLSDNKVLYSSANNTCWALNQEIIRLSVLLYTINEKILCLSHPINTNQVGKGLNVGLYYYYHFQQCNTQITINTCFMLSHVWVSCIY